MTGLWDVEADAVSKGDNLRNISNLTDKTWEDKDGFTHYVFSKILFNNPHYTIPNSEIELIKKFLAGGSRAYPSDGNTPCDVVAKEARLILYDIVEISMDPEDRHCDDACEALTHGKFKLVRGTMKLYLDKYTTRDWRRKRFTDDIDFWTFKVDILEHSLRNHGWKKNAKTREWEKEVFWDHPFTGKRESSYITAANDTNLLLDFGAGSYLEGSSLIEIIRKKLKRGHDVDLSDVLNVALANGSRNEQEWDEAWISFEEAANTRSSRISSNLISLCRYSLAIADYLDKVGKAIKTHRTLIFDKKSYPDHDLIRYCKTSVHWMAYLSANGPDKMREIIHDFLIDQEKLKPIQAQNLKKFTRKVLNLLNSKYKHLKVIFEVEI